MTFPLFADEPNEAVLLALSVSLTTPEVMFAGTFVGEDMSYSLGLDDVFEGDEGGSDIERGA